MQILASMFLSFIASLASIASTRLLGAVIAAIAVMLVGKFALNLVKKTMAKTGVDELLQKFVLSVVRVAIYFIAVMIVASALGFEMASLIALASVVSAAFALAASGVLANLFGGMLLLITKPFAVGDYIDVGGMEGLVLEVGLLNTKINTLDNKRITMPNSNVSSSTITNYSTEGKRRVDIVFKVGYENDMETVKSTILATAAAHEKVVDKDNLFVRVSSYEEYTVAYTMRVWTETANYWDVYFDMMEQVKKSFDKAGVKMVYPYLNVRTEQK